MHVDMPFNTKMIGGRAAGARKTNMAIFIAYMSELQLFSFILINIK